ncbi:MAG: hypothetical protein H6835_01990 [Planctomycetes bacterium]|nr:hypothetical protein [Planctomycetota bacterium]
MRPPRSPRALSRHWFALAAAAAVTTAADTIAQQPCAPAPVASGAMPGVDRAESLLGQWMNATSWDPDGAGPLGAQLVVCGTFRVAGSALAYGLATLDPASRTFHDLPSYATPERLFAGPAGQLLYNYLDIWAGSYPLMQWNGVSWTYAGVFDAMVTDIVWLPSGDMVVAGGFATVDSIPCTGLARRSGTTWQPFGQIWFNHVFQAPGWPPFPYNGPGWIYDLQQLANGDLVIAGVFDSIDGAPIRGIARWDGSQWQSMGAGVSGIWARSAVDWGGNLLATGHFAAGEWVLWDGSDWQPFPLPPSTGRAPVVTPSGDLLAVGTAGISRFASTGWSDIAWDNQQLTGVVPMPNGELYAFGEFDAVDGVPAARIARYDGEWHALGEGFNRPAAGVALLTDGDLLVGGSFTGRGDRELSPLQRFDGAQWSDVVTQRDTVVTAVASAPLGEALAIGSFPMPAHRPAQPIVRIIGNTVEPLPPLTFWQTCEPLVMSSRDATQTVIACRDRRKGGVVLARWDGSTLTSQSVQNLSGRASAVLLENDGSVTLGGEFQGPASSWQVVTVAGATWTGVVQGLTGELRALLRDDQGDLLCGGAFQHGNVFNLGRWDGTAMFSMSTAWTGAVGALARLPDGDLLAFSQLLTRWNGSTWDRLGWFEEPVRGVAVHDDGVLDIVGEFATAGRMVNGVLTTLPGAHYVRFEPPCPALADAYGSGCTSAAGPVELQSTRPWLGTTVRATTTGVPTGGGAVPVLGLGSTALPLAQLFPQAGAGCTILVTSDALLGLAPEVGGVATTLLPLPNDAVLVGFELRVQAFTFAAVGGAPDVASSGALRLTLGTL